MTRSIQVCAFLILCALNVHAQDDLITFEFTGSVVTDEGTPVPSATVQLSFIKVFVDENQITQSENSRVVVQTGADGTYSLQLRLDPDWTNFVLGITATNLDSLRYELPSDRQLTDAIRTYIGSGSFNMVVNWRIVSKPGWQEQLETIRQYGEESDKGKLIRARGTPERIVPFTKYDPVNRRRVRGELWYYYKLGMVVRFIGDTRDKDFRFMPR